MTLRPDRGPGGKAGMFQDERVLLVSSRRPSRGVFWRIDGPVGSLFESLFN